MFSSKVNMILVIVYLSVVLIEANISTDILHIYKNKFNGDGTYYGVNDVGGTCQYNPPTFPHAALDPIIKHHVALNKPQFLGSYTCGMCFKVHADGVGKGTSPIKGDFIVFVQDLCPECLEGSLDFAVVGDGRWAINVQAVQCPVGNTKIDYKFQGSNGYYMKVQVRNARIPVVFFKMQQSGQWVDLQHTQDGFWLLSNNKAVDTTNINIKLTAANGEVLNDVIPKLENGVAIMGTKQVQFALDPNLPTA